MGYMDKWPLRMQGLGLGWVRPGSGFFNVAPARHPNVCNACRGYLERPSDIEGQTHLGILKVLIGLALD